MEEKNTTNNSNENEKIESTKSIKTETNDIKENKKPEDNKKDKKDKNKKDSNKGSFFNEHKAEFKKIIWPSREDLLKQTVTVIIVSILVGAIIFGMDSIYNIGYTQFVNLLA